MTKLHSISIASFLARESTKMNWLVAYCTPETYGSLDSDRNEQAWIDIMVVPLEETAIMLNENNGRGIIIPGHESDRLIVALGEIEPPGGIITMTQTKGRPDLRNLSERRNRKIITQLKRIRPDAWEKKVISIEGPDEMATIVKEQIEIAKKYNAPVIIYPMGPKPLIFSAAHILSRYYPEASWIVYPIPSNYDANYSDGIGDVLWIMQKE